jgi:hypothetical protein
VTISPHHEINTLFFPFYASPLRYYLSIKAFYMVGVLLGRIQATPHTSPTPIELKDMLACLPAWRKKVLSIIAWYTLAVW